MTDLEASLMIGRAYLENSAKDAYWSKVWPRDGGYVLAKEYGQTLYILWRGSYTPLDWLLNFTATPTKDGSIGMVHKGFVVGVWAVQDELDAYASSLCANKNITKIVVTGHSRGAAQACDYAGHAVMQGLPVTDLILFGCPRPGYQTLADILKNHKVNIRSYRNGDDPVTKVPFNIDLIGTTCDFPYVDVADFTQLHERPPKHDSWGIVADHHWQLYARGLYAKNNNLEI